MAGGRIADLNWHTGAMRKRRALRVVARPVLQASVAAVMLSAADREFDVWRRFVR